MTAAPDGDTHKALVGLVHNEAAALSHFLFLHFSGSQAALFMLAKCFPALSQFPSCNQLPPCGRMSTGLFATRRRRRRQRVHRGWSETSLVEESRLALFSAGLLMDVIITDVSAEPPLITSSQRSPARLSLHVVVGAAAAFSV